MEGWMPPQVRPVSSAIRLFEHGPLRPHTSPTPAIPTPCHRVVSGVGLTHPGPLVRENIHQRRGDCSELDSLEGLGRREEQRPRGGVWPREEAWWGWGGAWFAGAEPGGDWAGPRRSKAGTGGARALAGQWNQLEPQAGAAESGQGASLNFQDPLLS